MRRAALIVILLVILSFISGCIKDKEEKTIEQNISKPVYKSNMSKSDQVEKYRELMTESKNVVEIARKDLAAKLNIPENEIKIDIIVPVEWPDTSFGYPDKNKKYEMKFTSGYVILLLAKEKLYEYHSDRGYKIVPPPDYLPIKDSLDESYESDAPPEIIQLAKDDLAKRLQIPVEDIKVLKVFSTEWSDASLGYPEPGKSYVQNIIPGYVILLSAKDQSYEYHSDYKRIVNPPDNKK